MNHITIILVSKHIYVITSFKLFNHIYFLYIYYDLNVMVEFNLLMHIS